MTDESLKAALTLERAGTSRVGRDRVRLLQAIGAEGSIAAAARAVGLSYKAAWDAVGALNNLFAQPLVEAAPGGAKGGGAAVTPAGRALIESYGTIEASLAKALDALDRSLDAPREGGVALLGSLMMQTSTRNTFLCTVSDVTEGAVSAEITLALGDDHTLSAVITERSVAGMGLAPGTQVFALIKAPFVMLAAGEAPAAMSACNRLSGTVADRHDGPVNSEITLDLGAGKSITAIVTRSSAEALHLAPGAPATAFFPASHVILAMP